MIWIACSGSREGRSGRSAQPDGCLLDAPTGPTSRPCSSLLEEVDFSHLLLAHGGPVIGNGRERLQELVDVGGRTAFEM